jgi:hypothetical protein
VEWGLGLNLSTAIDGIPDSQLELRVTKRSRTPSGTYLYLETFDILKPIMKTMDFQLIWHKGDP